MSSPDEVREREAFLEWWASPKNDERRRSKHESAYKGAAWQSWQAAYASSTAVREQALRDAAAAVIGRVRRLVWAHDGDYNLAIADAEKTILALITTPQEPVCPTK